MNTLQNEVNSTLAEMAVYVMQKALAVLTKSSELESHCFLIHFICRFSHR